MRVAILSFHSHSDRSFLDDRELAVLSGELRDEGVTNDRVEVVFDEGAGETAGEPNQAVLERLSTCLAEYDVIAFQRVHSVERLGLLRERLPGKPFVRLEGEHALDETHSDYVCKHPLTETLARLAHHLTTQPEEGLRERSPRTSEHSAKRRAFQPNLFPIQINPAALPALRTFTVLGNKGCPYQSDARDNPLYAGVEIPEGYGRGCAFCTSGNVYERSADTVERVLGELEFLHQSGAERRDIVLKDQNPFAYLTELIERCAERKLQPFTLLLETRADWFLKAEARFARALAVAEQANLSIAPYLVGIENFSQAELDRFNKGITAEENERFLRCLRDWKKRYGAALNLDHASFGFVLFTPWTTLDDLETNFHAIKKTRFYELRGRLLLSRARLYPDNALYYLAARDGLLGAEFASPAEDNSRRYGYLPAHPWRFAHAEVAHFSQLATTLCEATGGRDELRLFETLLDAFRARPWHEVEASAILRELSHEPTNASTKRMHEQQLFLIQDDALEDRVLARRAPAAKAANKPFAELEAEIARAPDVYRWVLTGGRPTRHRDFYRVLERITATTAERIALEIDGGALAEPGVLERLAEAGVSELFVHLPALGEQAHREMLGDDPVRECLEGVANACRSGLATYVVLTLARPNVREVPRVVEWLVSLPQRPKAILLALPTPSRLTVADRARVLPPLAAAELASKVFDRCRRMSIEFGFRSKRGVAACTARGVLDRHGTVFHDRHMFFRNGNAERFQRVRVCTTCSLQHTCKGIEPALVALFGEAQLAPIPLEVSMDWRLQEINKLGVREYRNVSPFRVSGRGETRGLLRINGHCNMSCAFCFVDRTAPDFAADGLISEIDCMLAAGTQHVVISGGEPTLHPDLPRLIRHARAGGAHTVEIQTNGVRCAKLEYASSLVDAGLTKVTISLHSADPEHSDKITRLPGAFGKTIQAMHNFRELGVLTQVAHVITKSNYQELPGMMRFLGERFPREEAELSVCVAIAQGISDLVYGWVVPRFSDIRPYVREALDYCLEEHIGFGGMIGQGGYPPCMLDGELKYYQDAYDHLYVSDDWADQFHKTERCQQCVFDPHCLGVRKSYVETYGDEELVPFSADPRLLPSSAPVASASTTKLVPLRVPQRATERGS